VRACVSVESGHEEAGNLVALLRRGAVEQQMSQQGLQARGHDFDNWSVVVAGEAKLAKELYVETDWHGAAPAGDARASPARLVTA